MSSKKVHRLTNPRKLTADEAAEARRLRELVEKDKHEIIAEGRRELGEKRRHRGAAGPDQRTSWSKTECLAEKPWRHIAA